MSDDRLAHLTWRTVTQEDFEALVEIAKAARDRTNEEDHCIVCFHYPNVAGHAEGCALARLDSGAAA